MIYGKYGVIKSAIHIRGESLVACMHGLGFAYTVIADASLLLVPYRGSLFMNQ